MSVVAIRDNRVIAFVLRVSPDRPRDPPFRFPLVTRVHVTVEDGHRVTENLVVDTSQSVVATGRLHSLANQRQVEKEDPPPLPIKISQMVDGLVVAKQQRITRKVLSVTDDREATRHSRHDHRVLAAERSGDGWIASGHAPKLPPCAARAPRLAVRVHSTTLNVPPQWAPHQQRAER